MANPEVSTQDNSSLVLGYGEVARGLTVLQDAGGVIPKGAVLGVITASGKLKRAVAAATDGSNRARYIALDDINAIAGDVTNVTVLKFGDVNANKLVFTGAQTLATVVNLVVTPSGTENLNMTYEEQLKMVGIKPVSGQAFIELNKQ